MPTVTDAVVEAIADDFERRFRTQSVDVFSPVGLRRVETGVAWFIIDDLGRMNPGQHAVREECG